MVHGNVSLDNDIWDCDITHDEKKKMSAPIVRAGQKKMRQS